ncbi:Rha family transcriptional regulator [Bacillus sp. JJ1566]|uniref:Rha family transcriptional regulator n=1 Tax=Bacillus sp. JJ1566 TaxID=3122961 RepID=UPI002FFFBC8D
MNQLQIINQNGQLLVDSREVAEMTQVRHADLLEKIKSFVKYLTNGDFRSSDFFKETTYRDSKGEIRPCYLLTRKGCDMVANKMTGEKGVLFTATYVTRFEQMENELKAPKTQLEILQGTINQLVEQDKRMSQLEGQVNNISNIVSLNNVGWREKVSVILKKIAKYWTGIDPYRSVINLSYERFEKRAGCKLDIRLNNRKERAIAQGMSKSYVQKINKLDVISEEKRLVEIYLQVIKEMAIEFRVNINDFKFEEGA